VRRWTYILLLCAVLAALGGLAAVANSQAGTHAEGEAAVLAAGLRADLARFEEHALHLARQSAATDARHLASFRGLVSAQRFDAAGKEIHRVERFGHIVAKLPALRLDAVRAAPPPPPNRVVVSGLEVDVERKDVHPDLRHVLRYAARTDTDGTLVLTVYAEPFLAPLREEGAALYDGSGAHLFGEAIDSGFRELGPAGAWWRVRVPVGVTRLQGGALLAYGAVLLGLFLLAGGLAVFLERQVRAQERAALEQRLARSERLGSIGLLVTGIAHEINNPLEGIANWMRLGKTDKVQEGLDRIRKIVRDLLQCARPDVETGSADFVESFARALELARYAPDCKKLTGELEWP